MRLTLPASGNCITALGWHILVIVWLFQLPLTAAEWPHLRGPEYNAVSREMGLVEQWPEAGPPVLWTREMGAGYSGFVIGGDRVFTQIQSLYGQYVVCLQAATGETLWEHRYDWPYEGAGLYPGPRATPTLAGDKDRRINKCLLVADAASIRTDAGSVGHNSYSCAGPKVYFAGPRGQVGCLTAAGGREVWSINVTEKFKGRGTGFGYACSPLVIQGKVVLPVGGEGASVVALDAATGETVWSSGDEPASYCSAMPIEFAGRTLIVAFLQNSMAGFDLETGRVQWLHKYSQGYDEHSAQPLCEEPYLLTASPFQGGSSLYRLETETVEGAEPRVSARLTRQSKLLSNDVASSLVLDGQVYGFDLRDVQSKLHRASRGEFKCLDLRSGEVRWSTRQVGHATVLAADGKLLLFNDQGEVILARAQLEAYEELARTRVFTGEICWTAPALCDGRLYVRSPTRAACLFVGRTEQLTPEALASSVPASELPQTSRFDLGWLLGGEREFPFDPPSLRELTVWYVACLVGALVPAMFIAGIVGWLRGRKLAERGKNGGGVSAFAWTWLAATFVLGIAATPLLNLVCPEFVFTWPATLFAAFQATVSLIVWSGRQPASRRARWISRLAALGLVGVSLLYFHFCLRFSMAMEGVFLMGFPAAFPVAIYAAWRQVSRPRFWHFSLCALLGFSLFFWSSGAFITWRMAEYRTGNPTVAGKPVVAFR